MTISNEQRFLTLARTCGTPLKLAKLFNDIVSGKVTDKDTLLNVVGAAYFFRSVFDRWGYFNGPQEGDYPVGYGLKGKALKARVQEWKRREQEWDRRYEMVKPYLTFNGKNYKDAINKGVTAIEEAVREAAWRKEGYDAKTGKKGRGR